MYQEKTQEKSIESSIKINKGNRFQKKVVIAIETPIEHVENPNQTLETSQCKNSGVTSPELGLQIRTTRGLVLDDDGLVDNGHLLECGEQLRLHHVLGHLHHEQLHDLLHSAHTSTSSNGGSGDGSFLDARRTTPHD